MNVELAVRGPVDCEPLAFLVPDHAPEAAHWLAFWLLQVRFEEAPELTVLGLACRVTTTGMAVTETVTDCVAEPPGPVQVST